MANDGATGVDVEQTLRRIEGLAARVSGPAGAESSDALVSELRTVLEEVRFQRELLVSARYELQAERDRLRELFDLAPDAYLVTDAAGVIREANRQAAALLGDSEEELPGRLLSAYVAETQQPVLAGRLLRLARSADTMEYELRIVPRRGPPATVGVAVAAAHQDGRVVGLRWLLRDVTHEKQARQATRRLLEEQAARAHAENAQRRDAFLAEAGEILAGSLEYEITLASVARLAVPRIADSCIAYLVDEDGRVRRLGIAHADPVREERLRALLEHRPFDAESLTGPVARVLRTGEAELLPVVPPFHGARGALDPDEADLAPRSLMIVPLRIRERTLGALSLGWSEPGKYTPDALWLARKLADRAALAVENARLHREARRASEAKSDFVAAMSHEFRTPLTAILAFADMLVAGIPEPITGAPLRHAERIAGAARHLGQLIDQVLTLSRIEAGRERVQVGETDLAALVRDTAALVEPLARQKGLGFVVEAPEGGTTVRTDPNKLRQVLFNLLGNAVKFTERGEVRMRMRVGKDGAVLEVHDTGEGIPAESLERIWEPFWQAAGSDRPGGTGLGLGIVRRLVHLLGGEIHARSEPGRGSVFTVELKVHPGEPRALPGGEVPASPGR